MALIRFRFPGSPGIRKQASAAAVAAILAAALYVHRGAFAGFFVQDDYGWLESSRFASFGEYAAIFFRFNPALTYRPLSQETFFYLGQKAFGLWPPGYHFMSLALFLTASALVYLLARRFCPVLPSSRWDLLLCAALGADALRSMDLRGSGTDGSGLHPFVPAASHPLLPGIRSLQNREAASCLQ